MTWMTMDITAGKPSAGICPRIPILLRLRRVLQMLTVAHKARECSALATAAWTCGRVKLLDAGRARAAGAPTSGTTTRAAAKNRLKLILNLSTA